MIDRVEVAIGQYSRSRLTVVSLQTSLVAQFGQPVSLLLAVLFELQISNQWQPQTKRHKQRCRFSDVIVRCASLPRSNSSKSARKRGHLSVAICGRLIDVRELIELYSFSSRFNDHKELLASATTRPDHTWSGRSAIEQSLAPLLVKIKARWERVVED